ncbi:MAG: mechanosensitive ion channel protein MscS, partial [Nitrospirales bacterium]
WKEAEQVLLDAARAECAPIMEVAKRHMKEIEGRTWLDAPSVEPRVTIHLPQPGRIDLLVRFPAPAHRTAKLEQAILRRFLSAYQPKPAVHLG